MRVEPLLKLLKTVSEQTLYPEEILIIDGSTNQDTEVMLLDNRFDKLVYHKVSDENRGLTKQRNFGISKVSNDIEIVCFLDDDILLEDTYFEALASTYKKHPSALGVGGYITNEVQWTAVKNHNYKALRNEFYYDGYKRKEGSRFILRKMLNLDTDVPPGSFPEFGHGRSVNFLPPSGKIYEVEQFMGGVSSYRKEIFQKIRFSDYFDGYGLYEDADFCFRLFRLGKLYINTAACCEHHHHPSGRPDTYKYGKMVMRNGWYVWKVRHSNPFLNSRIKWNLISLLLMLIRFANVITTSKKTDAFKEAIGRGIGWLSLLFNRPKIKNG